MPFLGPEFCTQDAHQHVIVGIAKMVENVAILPGNHYLAVRQRMCREGTYVLQSLRECIYYWDSTRMLVACWFDQVINLTNSHELGEHRGAV
jgi:hypothetical protein